MQTTRSSPVWHSIALVLLCLALYLPGQESLPPVDRDEARFAQASKQMLESGDFLDIRFQDEPRHKKPVGIYWLQSAAVALSGAPRDAIWPYRLPSLIGAILSVWLTMRIGAQLFHPAVGLLGAVILAFSLLLGVEARLATTDAALLGCVLASHYLLALAYIHRHGPWRASLVQWLVGWSALALGVLIKGPAVLLFVALTGLAVSLSLGSVAWLKALRPLHGALWATLLCLPWFVAISLQSDGGFLRSSLGGDIVPKLLGGQESHGAPPGTHLLILAAAFWPGTLLLTLSLPWLKRRLRHPGIRFCLAWILPAWLVFELIPTKLPHYLLPLYPALALLAARAWLSATTTGSKTYRLWMRGLWVSLGILPPIALVTAYYYLTDRAIAPSAVSVIILSATVALAGIVRFGLRPVDSRALGLLLGGCLLFYLTGFQWLVPALEPLWLSRSVNDAVHRATPVSCTGARLLSVDYHEPSLVFLAGSDTLLLHRQDPRTGPRIASHLKQLGCRAALLPADQGHPLNGDPRIKKLARIRGINYSKGKRLDLQLWGNAAMVAATLPRTPTP